LLKRLLPYSFFVSANLFEGCRFTMTANGQGFLPVLIFRDPSARTAAE